MAAVGAEHIRQGLWVKPRGTPQTTGDRPGQWHEILEIFHPKGRKQWNGGGRPALYRDPIVRDKANRSTKPLSLMQKLVMDFTLPGELVVDLYAGLGTTLLACKQLGRRCLGFEKDEANALASRDRLRQLLLGLEDPDLALPRWALRDPMLFHAQRPGFSPSDIPEVLPTKKQMGLFDSNLN
jgi:site-specific DNA-methyltransferase (adenine-specific)